DVHVYVNVRPHQIFDRRGDQYVKVTIEVPKNLNSKQKEILKQFEGATTDKNYAKRKGFFDVIKKLFD
ncbi:MAG: hypothetical protein IJ346_02730, partial [Clostridia bacterium]|nr:hypothetical protein [Clostridia bacterium]